MPITPKFDITQTLEVVVVTIHVPNIRVSQESIEVLVEEGNNTLHFFSSPYLLKLAFPHPFQENAHESCAQYDPAQSTITLKLAKKEAADWPNLDLIGSLIQPKPVNSRWLKEISDNQTETDTKENTSRSQHVEHCDENTFMTDTHKEGDADLVPCLTEIGDGYGFASMFHRIFIDFCRAGMAEEMLQLEDPESSTIESRTNGRLAHELENFDPDRYLADLELEEEYLFTMAMDFEPHWNSSLVDLMKQLEVNDGGPNSDTEPSQSFTEEERHLLSTIPYPLLPNIIDPDREFHGLLDILFSYVYDHLLTQGEPTVESAWTISCLSSRLSWLDEFNSVEDAVIASLRRSLVYPYIRNFEFGVHIWRQVAYILADRRCIIRCLLQVRDILEKSETFYVGNKLYIDPLLLWIQQAQAIPVKPLTSQILKCLDDPSLKSKLDLDLVAFESLLGDHADEEDGSSSVSDKEPSSSESSEDDTYSSNSEVSDDSEDEGPSMNTNKATRVSEKLKTSGSLLDSDIGFGGSEMLKVSESPLLSGGLGKESHGKSKGETATSPSSAPRKSPPVRKLIEEL